MGVREFYENKYCSFKSVTSYTAEKRFFGFQLECLEQKYGSLDFQKSSILDLGCGFGMKTYLLAEKAKHVVGVDFIPQVLEINKLLNDKSNLQFFFQDLTGKKDIEGKFDIVTAFGLSILNTPSKEKFLAFIDQITKGYLKERGKIVIWSSTDYSATDKNGWYNHSMEELNGIVGEIRNVMNCQVDIFRPYKHFTFKNFSLEYAYRSLRSKQYYFIIIST